MRVWDINPGYLSNQNLLGEHVEIHAIYSVITKNKKGYSNHPETKRWIKNICGLKSRHDLVVSEMYIRGFRHNSDINYSNEGGYPDSYIDFPFEQLLILKNKYSLKINTSPRIPVPKNIQELWSQHKYSALARTPVRYKQIGKSIASSKNMKIEELALELTEMLRIQPVQPRLINAVEHLFGYVSKYCREKNECASLKSKFELIIKLAFENNVEYLLHSTALSDFYFWLKYGNNSNKG